MDDGENTEALLSVSVDVPLDGGDTGGEVGGGTMTLQKALYRNPREAIKWLESKGICKFSLPCVACHFAQTAHGTLDGARPCLSSWQSYFCGAEGPADV